MTIILNTVFENRLKERPNYIDFINIWLPREEKYFREINPKAKANLIIK